jgi:hypothetical protein
VEPALSPNFGSQAAESSITPQKPSFTIATGAIAGRESSPDPEFAMFDCRRLCLSVVSLRTVFGSFASRKSSPRSGLLLRALVVLAGLLLPTVAPAQTLIPNWVQLSPATSPSARGNYAVAYDAAHGQIVLFGGYSGPGAYLGDTWIWNGTTWTQKSPANSPPGRSNSAMAYDAAHAQIVLFGGENSGGFLSDTWVWDGTNWTHESPATSPSSRYSHAMAYDVAHRQVVLFGGRNSGGYLSDTWFWNGSTWTHENPATSPPGRYNATMTYDAASGQTVLFGGFGGSYLNDTWVWNGTTWTLQSPATSPGARFASAMAYDAVSGQTVLFGGYSGPGAYLGDTWIWGGSNWTEENPATTPPARDYASMAYDVASGQMVFFGGGGGTGGFMDDTWTLQLGSVNLGSANVCPVGSTTPSPCSQTATVWFGVAANTTIGSIQIRTMGATGEDFTVTSPDTSTTLCTAKTYTAATTCSVDVTFSPKYPGQRQGAVQLLNSTGTAALVTVNLYGQGVGGRAAFPPAIINTVAGKGSWMSPPSYSGDGGLAINANLWGPGSTALDGAGNLYIADSGNYRVRKVDATTGYISTVAGNGSGNHSGDGSAATNAAIGSPNSVALDGAGNLYIGDSGNSLVRKVNAAGIISTVAGNASLGYSGDGGLAIHAEFCSANNLALDGAGNLYIDDGCFNTIRKVDAATGIISTVAGYYNSGQGGYSGDGGPATSALLNSPLGLALDAAGNMYIADTNNNRIRKVDAATGIISTVAGNGSNGHSGDGVLALQAHLEVPQGMALDAAGNLYLVDTYYNCIRKVNAQNGAVSASSTLSTVAGTCNKSGNLSGDGGAATSAKLSNAQDITLDSAGNLYITDAGNNRIREVSAATPPTLNFAATDAGLASSDSPKTVTLENTGNGDLTFPIPSTGYNPSIAAGFTLDSTVSNACPLVSSSSQAAATLAAGDSCILSMSFAPVASGLDNGSLTLTDNSAPGSQAITLQGTGNTVTLTANAGSGQSTAINTAFGTALSANVQDGSGNPVANEVVTFTAPASGASGTFANGLITATATTGSNGVATASAFTANATGGSYTVTATLDSLSASFNLSNLLPPTVTAVSPSSGLAAGGTAVTITGMNFTGATGITIGGAAATSVAVVSGTTITAVTPAGTAGTASVDVTTPSGSNAANTLFTYVAPPTISKTFGAATIPLNGITTLTFTITNPNTVTTLTGVAFTDTFPSGLQWDINSGGTVTGDCGTKTITLIANTYVRLDGATISAGGSCIFSVNVVGITAGVKNNTTGAVSSNNGGTGNTASASLTVEYQLSTAANPAAGGGTVTPVSGNLYNPGTIVPLLAIPATGYTFRNWTSSPDSVANPTSASTSITMNTTETVTANFTPTLVVNTANDDSGTAANCTPQATPGTNTVDAVCSLRDALLFAANAGSANISFDSTKFAATNTASQNTINLTNGTLTIPSNTSITGATSGSGSTLTNLVTVAGGGSSSNFSVVTVNSGVTAAAINNLTITKGNSLSGGGIYNNGTLTVSNSTVSGNSSQLGGNGGGGIYNAGSLTIINSTVSGNTTINGGGIYNSGTLTVTNSTVSGNAAGALGGGIFNDATLTVSNSTVSGNSADYYGGGIDNNGLSTLTVSNSTFSGNSTAGSGGGIYNSAGTLTLANTIDAGNTAGSGPDVYGTATDNGYNLIGNGTGSTGVANGVNGNQVGTSASPLNPNLALLANYGGPTQTMLPQPGSPAICAISPSTASGTDQRGDPRTTTYGTTTCQDSGAVQTNYALSFTPNPGASQVAGVPFNTAVTLTESASPVSGVTIPLTLNGGGTLSGGSASTNSSGVASYTLTVASSTALSGLTLTATLPSPPTLTPNSTSFNLSEPTPTVSGVSPFSGPTAGGTPVTITGTNFTGATGVTIGGAAATSVVVVSGTTITAVTPAGTAGTASVVVTTPGGSNTANTLFTYVAPPTVSGVSPSSGPTAGGTPVTITGTNFTGATTVTFGTTAATSFTVNSATQITATSPARSAGTVDVTVTTPGGSSATGIADQFTYVAPPTVSGVSPSSGPLAGGTSVTITGTNFTGATGVTIGGAAATSVVVVSGTTITAVTPAGTAGTASVTVTTPGGSNTANTLFTYVAPPTVSGVSPSSGPLAGGTSVTITGTNFTGATGVKFGTTPATNVMVVNSTTITATSTAGVGTVNVTVTTAGGTSATSTADQFTYIAPASTSLAPVVMPSSTFVYDQQPGISFALTPSNAAGIVAGDFTATLDGTTSLTVTAGAGNTFSIVLPATPLTVGAHSIAVNFTGTPFYLVSGTNISLTVTTPGFVVNTANDDATGTASNCPANAPNPTTNGSGTCSLRDALAAASAAGGGAIAFDSTVFAASNTVAQNTITLNAGGTLNIPSNTSITGATSDSGASLTNLVTVSGNNTYGVFSVASGVTGAAISNLTITRGMGNGGGAINNGGALTVNTCTFSNNTTSQGVSEMGGAIDNTGQLTLNNSTFSNNNAQAAGGAIYSGWDSYSGSGLNANLAVNNSTFTSNTGGQGGAIYNSGSVTMTNSTISGNTGSGAAIFNNGVAMGNNNILNENPVNLCAGLGCYNNTNTNRAYFLVSGADQQVGGGWDSGTITLAWSDSIGNHYSYTVNYGQFSTPASIASGFGGGISNNLMPAASAEGFGSYFVLSIYNGASLGSFTITNSSKSFTLKQVYQSLLFTNNGNIMGTAANLSPLGNYGGPTQTMMPLPGSEAICSGTLTPANNNASGVPITIPTTDQRGFSRTNSIYPGYTSGPACVDAGAVQTNYAMSFTTQPPASIEANVAFSAPNITTVALTESGSTATFASTPPSSSVTASSNPASVGGTTSANLSSGVASFSGLSIAATTTTNVEQLTATLTLYGALNLTATSNTFSVIAINLSPTSLTNAQVGVAYSQSISASGGTAPYTYTATGLPAGLNISNTGLLSGTPTTGGSFNLTITATDSLGHSGSQAYTMTVSAPTITVTPSTLASGTYGTSYNQSVSASGGTGPYTYALASGSSLPPGLSLSSSGTITGTPTAASASAYTFTIIATDSSTGTGPYTGSQLVSLTINQASATINVTPYTVTYDGISHTAMGTATGVGGINLAADLTLSGTTHTNTGTYATDGWSFTDPNRNYASAYGTVSDTINQASQTITFPVGINPSTPAITSYTYSTGGSFTLRASTSSGLAASYTSLTTGVCTVNGKTAYIVTAGTCTIQATQTGNTNYSAATPVSYNFTINQALQTITYSPAVTSYPYSSGGTFNLSASSSASLTVSFASTTSGVCTITGTTAYIVTAGTCTIQATQTGNVDYSAATPVSVNYTISQVMPTITLVSSLNPILLLNPVTYTATVSSAAGKPTGTVTFEDGGTAITACANVPVTASTGLASCAVTYTVTGTHNITAVYSGDTNFLAAGPSNTVSEAAIDIILGTPTTSETILPGGTATYSFPIAPSSGTTFPSPVTFSVTSSPALPSGTTMTLTPPAWVFTSSNPWSWTLPANTPLTSNTVLTIQLPQTTASAQPADGNLISRLAPFSLALLLLPFAGRLRKSGKRLGRMLAVVLLAGAAMLAGLSGCGSNTGFFAQTQQSYKVTVTVGSGSLSHTTTVTLTVE